MGMLDRLNSLNTDKDVQVLPPEFMKMLQHLAYTDPAKVHQIREQYKDNDMMYRALAPYEHMAFTKQTTQENPLMGGLLSLASPAYYLAKQPYIRPLAERIKIGGKPLVEPDATPPSLDQLKGEWRGIGAGFNSFFAK
jgi:hypothetical protein